MALESKFEAWVFSHGFDAINWTLGYVMCGMFVCALGGQVP